MLLQVGGKDKDIPLLGVGRKRHSRVNLNGHVGKNDF
jgi:hypothetical protein